MSKESLAKNKSMCILEKVLLLLAFLIPCMPKIQVADGITIYPYEAFALMSFPILLRNIKFGIQKTLLYLWMVIFFSTLLSCLFVFTSGGLMRCLKEIIYIPLMYMACKYRIVTFRRYTLVFLIACVANISYLISMDMSSLDIWSPNMLSSGLSNKIFSFDSFSVEVIPTAGGSHGIWLGYNSLSVCMAYIAYKKRDISKRILWIVSLFAMINVLMSVSREGLIGFVFVCIGILKDCFHGYHNRLKIWLVVSVLVVLIIFIVVHYGENLAIVQKILYTQESFASNGNESNISSRLGAWYVYFRSIIENPLFFIIGYGFNQDYYSEVIRPIVYNYDGIYVAVPESFFVEVVMYGGVFALLLGLSFWKKLFCFFKSLRYLNSNIVFVWLLIGLLIGNIFSGASIISDLLYSQLLLSCGILLRSELQNGNSSIRRMVI